MDGITVILKNLDLRFVKMGNMWSHLFDSMKFCKVGQNDSIQVFFGIFKEMVQLDHLHYTGISKYSLDIGTF